MDNVWSEETNTSLHKDPSSNKPVLLSLNPTICTSLLHRGSVKRKGTAERRNSPRAPSRGALQNPDVANRHRDLDSSLDNICTETECLQLNVLELLRRKPELKGLCYSNSLWPSKS